MAVDQIISGVEICQLGAGYFLIEFTEINGEDVRGFAGIGERAGGGDAAYPQVEHLESIEG